MLLSGLFALTHQADDGASGLLAFAETRRGGKFIFSAFAETSRGGKFVLSAFAKTLCVGKYSLSENAEARCDKLPVLSIFVNTIRVFEFRFSWLLLDSELCFAVFRFVCFI